MLKTIKKIYKIFMNKMNKVTLINKKISKFRFNIFLILDEI